MIFSDKLARNGRTFMRFFFLIDVDTYRKKHENSLTFPQGS